MITIVSAGRVITRIVILILMKIIMSVTITTITPNY